MQTLLSHYWESHKLRFVKAQVHPLFILNKSSVRLAYHLTSAQTTCWLKETKDTLVCSQFYAQRRLGLKDMIWSNILLFCSFFLHLIIFLYGIYGNLTQPLSGCFSQRLHYFLNEVLFF